MTIQYAQSIERQLGASLDMLENAMNISTPQMWDNKEDNPPFWQTLHHAMFFVDFYFSTFDHEINDPLQTYKRPTFLESYYPDEWKDEIPDTTIEIKLSRQYFKHIRKRLRFYFDNDIEAQFNEPSGFEWLAMSKGELILYNIRHVMEHCAILNQVLKKHGLKASGWTKIGEI